MKESINQIVFSLNESDENTIGDVEAIRKRHRHTTPMRRVEIPEELARLVDTRRDSQTCKVFDWVASASSLSSREKSNYSAFRRKRFRATLRESARCPP